MGTAVRRLALVTRDPSAKRRTDSGLRVERISDPRDALTRAAGGAFDAVALSLPGTEGLALAPQFRKANPKTIVVLLLPRGRRDLKREALKSGAQVVMPSTRDLDAQLDLVEAALETLRIAAVNRELTRMAAATAREIQAAVADTSRICAANRQRRSTLGKKGTLLPFGRPQA